MTTTEQSIQTVRRGKTVGVNRDGNPVGHAVKIKAGEWTAFVYVTAPPYDLARPGFGSEAEAVAFIGTHGQTPAHLAK